MSLEEIRKEIDTIDDELIQLLEKRFQLVANLLDQKKSLTDKSREAEILSKTDSPYIQNIYRTIFKNSKQMLLDAGFDALQLSP